MDKLGFSYEKLAKENPRLIYASSSGFGHSGPVESYPAYDTIVQAVAGLMSITGFADGPPTRVGTSVSDLIAGTFMFCGVVSALYAREKTGKGAQVDIAMSDCSFAYLEQALMHYVATGEPPPRIGNRHPIMTPFDTFEAADGQFVIAAGNDHLFKQLCDAIGRPELAADNRFLTNPDRLKNEALLKQELERALKKAPKDHWLKTIHAAGVPVAPILNVKEAAEHPQIAARNMLIESGGVRMPGNPVKISGYDDPKVRVGAPTLDQHGSALRLEFAPQAADPASSLPPPNSQASTQELLS
jgi:CoA:oxalate CoA-transferase